MEKVYCYVCKRLIGLFEWRDHVKKEKSIHGDDIYNKLKAGRINKHNIPLIQHKQELKIDRKISDFNR